MMNATFIRVVDGFAGDAALYSVTPPIDITVALEDGTIGTSGLSVGHVIGVNFGDTYRVYGSNADGQIISTGEIAGGEGSFADALDAIRGDYVEPEMPVEDDTPVDNPVDNGDGEPETPPANDAGDDLTGETVEGGVTP